MPKQLDPLLHSDILLATISAVVLNAYFNGLKGKRLTNPTYSSAAGLQG
jgi:uric acid transporter